MTGDTLTAALGYARRGWRVLPVHWIRDNGHCSCKYGPACETPGKHPRETGWQNMATISGPDICEWLQEQYPDANVGVATGFESGIFAVDVDDYHGGDATLAELVAEHGPLPATRTHRTGSGSSQYLFAYPDFAVISATDTLGRGIDTRGAGGMIVAPPSVSGKGPYAVIDDRDPVAAPEWLLGMLRARASRVGTSSSVAVAACEPVDHTAIPARLGELLEVALGDGEGRHKHFYRIVAEARRSGYTQGQTTTLATAWDVKVGKFGSRVPAQVATCWAKLDDEQRAITFSASPAGGRHRGAVSPADVWELPVPLGLRATLPAFPVDISPGWLRQQITCLAEFAQVPVDLPAVISLSVLAAAAGGRAVVEIRGSWREPLNLYTVTALPPGSRKSAAFAELTQPLLDTEQALTEKIGPQIIEAMTARKVAQRDADKLAAQASGVDNGEARDRALANAIDAAQLAEAITVPVMPKLVADDVTPEAAASLLAEQGGRLAVLSAEGGCFATLSGRYSGTPNLEVFLKGHSGDMLRVDRKGRPPEHIPHPALTLGLAVQPQVLRDIAQMPGFRGRGLLARILYSIPPNTVGSRKIRTDPIPEDVRDTYAASIRQLVLTLAEWDDPAVLMLTPEATELILTTAENLEPRLGPDGELGHVADWASKLIGATARIAGLLHLAAHLEDGWSQPVSAATMAAAVCAADYFIAHALAAFDGMGADPVLDDARHVLAWLARCPEKRFTKRDLFRAEQSRFKKIADLDPVLAILEQHGYIRQAEQPDRSGPGRKPSPEYAIHPDLDEAALRC